MRHIGWPSIEQFRNVIKCVEHRTSYCGDDANGKPIYNKLNLKPVLKFKGTVKIHGTNAGYAIDNHGTLWAQSRENIISVRVDNAGFASFTARKQHILSNMLNNVIDKYRSTNNPDLSFTNAVVFGEWCGKGINSGAAVCELPKMFLIFAMAVANEDGHKIYLKDEDVLEIFRRESHNIYNTNVDMTLADDGIYCILDFPCFEIDIDFNEPVMSQNILCDYTLNVENMCPVGASFGIKGIGEGIVWRCITPGYEDSRFWFKIKGDKHSKSKVRTTPIVDIERFNNINALSEMLANDGRLEQIFQNVFNTLNGGEPDIKRTGEFIKAVMSDIFKEESDTIAGNGFTGKDISNPISKIVAAFMMKKLKE